MVASDTSCRKFMLSCTLPLQYKSAQVTAHTELSNLDEEYILFTVKPPERDDFAFCLVNLNAFAHGIYMLCLLWNRTEDLEPPGCSPHRGDYFMHRCTHQGIQFMGFHHDGERNCEAELNETCQSVFDVFFPKRDKRMVVLPTEKHVFGQGMVNEGEFGFILAQQEEPTTTGNKNTADDEDDDEEADGEGTVFYIISQHRDLVWIPGAGKMLD